MSLKHIFKFLIILLLFSSCKGKQPETTGVSSSFPLNESQNRVVDLSNLFLNIEKDSLTQKILQYEEETTNQIAILTIDSIPKNNTIQYYGTQVANSWGVGQKDKNNGLLITISKFDRQIAISTGIGAEQTITDNDCKVIIDQLMIPEFKNQDYYKGVDKAIDSLILLWD